jgi:eukaryotic-like serine/threonine-protein kinase
VVPQQSYGPYRVVRKLGAGGMGEVFLAEHELIGRKAAIKVLHSDRSTKRESVDRFFNEARAAAVISDPGIVQIYDFGFTPDGTAYIVMENLEGEALSDRLHRLGALPIVDALRIVRQTAGSLAAAHAAGIVHRDLKPDNIFMVRDPEAAAGERPKILDFGIAKLSIDENRFKTHTGAVMGTPVYMSPEQCNDSGKIDHRTDIYSLGCVLHHLMTGRPPFDHRGIGALISAHLKEVPPAPSFVLGDTNLPPLIDHIVLRCLAKSPHDRFPNMLELQQACDAAMRESASLIAIPPSIQRPSAMAIDGSRTTLGSSVGESIDRPRSSRGLVLGLAALVLLIGVGVTAATLAGDDESVVHPVTRPEAAPARVDPAHVEPARIEPPRPPPAPPSPPAPPIVDAAVASPAPDALPAGSAAPAAGSAKPKPPPKPRPRQTPQTNDLYDDRN